MLADLLARASRACIDRQACRHQLHVAQHSRTSGGTWSWSSASGSFNAVFVSGKRALFNLPTVGHQIGSLPPISNHQERSKPQQIRPERSPCSSVTHSCTEGRTASAIC